MVEEDDSDDSSDQMSLGKNIFLCLKNVCMPNTSKLLFKSHTAIGFYVKTMSAHGSHLGWRSWSSEYITQGPSMPCLL
jgi:hypothetical protein